TYERPELPKGKPTDVRTALTLALGVVAGAIAHSSSSPALPLPPPVTRAPIVAAAPADPAYIPASLPPTAPAVATSATQPAAAPHALTDVDDEMSCLRAARAPLNARTPNPREALRLLVQCEQRFPRTKYPDVRKQIRQEAEAARSRAR